MLTGLNNYTRNVSVLLTVLSMINRLNISTHCAYWVILQVIPYIRGFHVSQNFGKLRKYVKKNLFASVRPVVIPLSIITILCVNFIRFISAFHPL